MPPPTVTCKLCNRQVSKRSTIELQPGSRERACRSHEEALEVKRQAMQKLQDAKLLTEATDAVAVLMLASQVRVLAAINGISNEMCYVVLQGRMPEHLRYDVLKEVQTLGPLSAKDAVDTLAVLGVMHDTR